MTRLLLPLDRRADCTDAAEQVLLRRLKKLPRRVQQVFLLNRLDQLPYAAIAQRLDLADATVERHMNLALHCTLDSPGALERFAGQWYVRLQSPQVTASERIDFRRWLDAAPEHLAAFHATELHWRRLLAPARQLGESHGYRHARAALSPGGCTVAMGLGLAVLLALGFWS